MNATVKVLLATMISGTLCGLATYVFTHKTLTIQLATAMQERANAKKELAKTSFDLSGVKKMLRAQGETARDCQRALDRTGQDVVECKYSLNYRIAEQAKCEDRLKAGTARLAALEDPPPPIIKLPKFGSSGAMSPNKLVVAYQENEIHADNLYLNKTLDVSGVVRTVGTDMLGNPYISFESDVLFTHVACYFTKDKSDQLSRLQAGQKVTVRGVCSGKGMLSVVALKKCKLLSS